MNKDEAALYLGISTRTLGRYVRDGKLEVRYEGAKTRPIAVYDLVELDRLKEEMGIVVVKPIVSDVEMTSSPDDLPVDSLMSIGRFFPGFKSLMERVVVALERRSEPEPTSSVPLADKFLLTLAEAQVLTGLSREMLKRAIVAGELPSRLMGKAYRVKRDDLKYYVDNLWLD